MPTEVGGFGGPRAVEVVVQEILSGANTAFNMYAGLTHGAADLLEHFGIPATKAKFLGPMLSGRFSGTMCLSEPHAGSDVGATRTKATHIEANLYHVTAPSAGSRPATTTWPRTSCTWCSPASRARPRAPRASRSSSFRRSG
jgi:alkylation response protein AidB-like acyl-CoA dehydrogenase